MNWKSEITKIDNGNIFKYSLFENDQKITFIYFIDLLINNSDFRSYYNDLLSQNPFSAYFWEHPPLNVHNVESPYEFVLVRNNALASVKADIHTFNEYFTKDDSVTSFSNLGGDAHLITPCPMNENLNIYAHLASFTRNVSQRQSNIFWQSVGKEILRNIKEENIWISTSGLGVYWLHVRIDQAPKYYHFDEYQNQY